MNLEIDDVPNIEITVKAETLEDDLFKIYNQLFKNSVKNDLEILELQGVNPYEKRLNLINLFSIHTCDFRAM